MASVNTESMAENEMEKMEAPRPGSAREVTARGLAFTERSGYKREGQHALP